MKQWIIQNSDPHLSAEEKLLLNRGLLDANEIQKFIESDVTTGLHDPYLLKDMKKAVERIKSAIHKQEKVIIFGDYDVDGISGTALLYNVLRELGALVSYRLPHRVEDGYGLSDKFIHTFHEIGANLVITVDCGISCKKQIALAAELGIDVIITDHHTVPAAIPEHAVAILHPLQPDCLYPFKGLTGSGVAFKLASALLAEKYNGEELNRQIFSYIDLASLGTVADIGPLIDENRIIVKNGLRALRKSRWPGLSLLLEYAGVDPDRKLDTTTIGFKIGPRINAAGRIDSPYYSLQLLIQEQAGEKGNSLARHLNELNVKRQDMVIKAMEEAEREYQNNHQGLNIIIAYSSEWHVGILGLIAGRLAEKYHLPTMILHDFGDRLVASARSPEYFNLVKAITHCKEVLEHFGGHAQAAGFSLSKEKLPEFIKLMIDYTNQEVAGKEHPHTLQIECELKPDELQMNLLDFLEKLEPFGQANEEPKFLISQVKIKNTKLFGKEQNHLAFTAYKDEKSWPVVAFKMSEEYRKLRPHQTIDLICRLEKNTWRDKTELRLQAVDFKIAE